MTKRKENQFYDELRTEKAEQICVQVRRDKKKGYSYRQLDAKYDIDFVTILRYLFGTCSVEVDEPPINSTKERPYTNEYILTVLVRERNMIHTKIGNLLDCHEETVSDYVDDIDTIGSNERTSSRQVNKLQRIGAERDDIEIR